ncbi:unnamed protein product [marine sediment metagenome]|uniref:Uncharacterized protein n=1 Tax=marine sediment metagenome TaxID=412755 RepID=X0RY52_9ZZZZ
MSQRMYVCFKCENKVRTLYEWEGEELFCGMCQQENIEKYEATIVYRFFLLLQLVKDCVNKSCDQVFFPERGWIRRLVKFTIYWIRETITHVKRIRAQCAKRRRQRKARREERRQHRKAEARSRAASKWARKEQRKAYKRICKENREWDKVHKAAR